MRSKIRNNISILIALLLFFCFLGLACSFYYYIFIFQPFRYDSDYYWVDDSVRLFIDKNKRLPEHWNELMSNAEESGLYPPIDGIEDRMELKFEWFKKINSSLKNSADFQPVSSCPDNVQSVEEICVCPIDLHSVQQIPDNIESEKEKTTARKTNDVCEIEF